jgi:hypothetical protein
MQKVFCKKKERRKYSAKRIYAEKIKHRFKKTARIISQKKRNLCKQKKIVLKKSNIV